jgi:hypothetical protein
MRGRVCRLQLLLALASAFIFGSESRGTRDHILLSDSRLPFSSPHTLRKATVEVFDPVSTRELFIIIIIIIIIINASGRLLPHNKLSEPDIEHLIKQFRYCLVSVVFKRSFRGCASNISNKVTTTDASPVDS